MAKAAAGSALKGSSVWPWADTEGLRAQGRGSRRCQEEGGARKGGGRAVSGDGMGAMALGGDVGGDTSVPCNCNCSIS